VGGGEGLGSMIHRFGESPQEGARLGLRGRACFRTSPLPPGVPSHINLGGSFSLAAIPGVGKKRPGTNRTDFPSDLDREMLKISEFYGLRPARLGMDIDLSATGSVLSF